MRTIPVLAIMAAATLLGVWISRPADQVPPAQPIPEADRDDGPPVSSLTSTPAPRPEERRPLPPGLPELRSLRLDVGYLIPPATPRADQEPLPPAEGQPSKQTVWHIVPEPVAFEASLRVDYRLYGTREQQHRAIAQYGDATIEEVRRILQERRRDEATLEELRNTIQHWLFRGSLAKVEQIEIVKDRSTRFPDAVHKPSRLLNPSSELLRDRIVLDGTISWQADDVELKFNVKLPEPRPALVSVGFQLSILVREGEMETAQSLVRQHMERGRSRCLELLSDQTFTGLTAADGKPRLKRLLRDELTSTLFPGPAWQRVAFVDDVFWTRFQVVELHVKSRKNPPLPH